MERIGEQLKSAAAVLEVLDRRRLETGDPGLGSAVEKAILDRHLADLEFDLMEHQQEEQLRELIYCRLRWRAV